MDHYNRRTRGIARSNVDDVERCAGDLDQPASCGIGALQGKNTGLRDQGEDCQRRHDSDQNHSTCPEEFGHRRATLYGGGASRGRLPSCDQNTRKPKRRVFFLGINRLRFWPEARGFSRHIARAFISPSSVTLYLSPSALLQPCGRVPSRLPPPELST